VICGGAGGRLLKSAQRFVGAGAPQRDPWLVATGLRAGRLFQWAPLLARPAVLFGPLFHSSYTAGTT
jgi:hypothetical protein